MTTTRYYLHGNQSYGANVPRDPSWFAANEATLSRNLSPVPSGNSTGGTAPRPTTRPNPTMGTQGITAPTTEGRTFLGTFRTVFPVSYIGTAYLRVILKVVDPSGVSLGTLADVTDPMAVPSGSTSLTRTVEGALTEVYAPAGSRIVFELGFYFVSGLGGSAGWSNYNSTSTADYPYEDGASVVTSTRPWVELILTDPPAAVTDLTASPSSDSVALEWGAPATGSAPSGYEVRVNGGAPTDVGPALAYTVPGLNPVTTYSLEVRGYSDAGPGPWTLVEATTLTGAAYRAVVRLGARVWDVLAGDPPTYGPILPLTFGWAVPEDSHGFPAQPNPDTLALELLTLTAADMAGVDIGTPARVSIYTSPAPTARPLATFVGSVADLEATPTDAGGLSWRLLAVGYTTDLAGHPVGGTDWPQESGDARAARIMAEAGLPGWTADPIGLTVEARGPETTNARAELERTLDAAVSTDGTDYGAARRVLIHPRVDAEGDLLPEAPYAGTAVTRRVDHIDRVTAGLINRRTTWRRTRLLDATWVTLDHPGGPTTYGDTRGAPYPPLTVPVTDPQEFADMILDTTPGYRWLTGDALRFELWAEEADTSAVLDWFYRDPASHPFPWSGRAVVVENIAQAPDGSTVHAGMLAAAALRLEPGGRLVVEFRLRPEIPAYSTVTYRWMDEPPTATWADEAAADPTGDWYAMRTTPRP